MSKKRIAIVDADIACFRAAAACQSIFKWDDDEEPTVYADAHRAATVAVDTIKAWASLADCTDIIACLTGRDNFRRSVLKTYKHTRAGKVKPQSYAHVVETVSRAFETRLVGGLEGDDLMGILATRYPVGDTVVLTMDKDARGTPGMLLNPLKDRAPTLITEAEADLFWMSQVLTGDTSDGYTGLPGCGPRGASKILGTVPASADYLWPKVVAAYRAKGLTEADALVQARVARILRDEDYNKHTKEVRLWHPQNPEWRTLESLIASQSKHSQTPSVPLSAPLVPIEELASAITPLIASTTNT
jgi:hypothetical protein